MRSDCARGRTWSLLLLIALGSAASPIDTVWLTTTRRQARGLPKGQSSPSASGGAPRRVLVPHRTALWQVQAPRHADLLCMSSLPADSCMPTRSCHLRRLRPAVLSGRDYCHAYHVPLPVWRMQYRAPAALVRCWVRGASHSHHMLLLERRAVQGPLLGSWPRPAWGCTARGTCLCLPAQRHRAERTAARACPPQGHAGRAGHPPPHGGLDRRGRRAGERRAGGGSACRHGCPAVPGEKGLCGCVCWGSAAATKWDGAGWMCWGPATAIEGPGRRMHLRTICSSTQPSGACAMARHGKTARARAGRKPRRMRLCLP